MKAAVILTDMAYQNQKDYLLRKLKKYKRENHILISSHALLRAKQRSISVFDVIHNLLHPKNLLFANRLESEFDSLEKFKCYFGMSKTQCHLYIIKVNSFVQVKTIVKINRRWQKRAEKW